MTVESIKNRDPLRFQFEAENNKQPIELYINPDVRQILKEGISIKQGLQVVKDEILRIEQNPFGETSIGSIILESKKLTDIIQAERAINELSSQAQESFTVPLIIKRGVDKLAQKNAFSKYGYICARSEDLVEQCRFMTRLKQAWESNASEALKKRIKFLPYYGAVRTQTHEYVVMAKAPGNETENVTVSIPMGMHGTIISYGETVGVDLAEHPGLSLLMDGDNRRVDWTLLDKKISTIVGFDIHGDLAGRNVFYDPVENTYTIFDQNSAEATSQSLQKDRELFDFYLEQRVQSYLQELKNEN